ncbi:MAG: anthranilate phosphoribosyltransferase [Planctomycetes bacterium]|nr:anthranilate phosphoribosyltransferase [Planctomycetota bacterium]
MKAYLTKVVEGKDLSRDEARRAMEIIMSGEATPAQIAAFLVALRMKGETVDEITGCAESMRALAVKVEAPTNAVDTCGTGGDGAHTFNISTAAALVTAAAGVPVAKHGNRSVSSKSGSADVLEKLGVKIDAAVPVVERSIAEAGFGFLFAPLMHGAMKHAIGPRRELALRTIFNILGPLTNPAGASCQLLGVFAPELMRPLAEVLRNLGSRRALIVHGDGGLDEISPFGPTHYVFLSEDGGISEGVVTPEDVGVPAVSDELRVDTPEESAALIREVFAGEDCPPRSAVLLNAAGALWAAGKAVSLAEGLKSAAEAVDSGAAALTLQAVADITNG